jgi:hypothetical protein
MAEYCAVCGECWSWKAEKCTFCHRRYVVCWDCWAKRAYLVLGGESAYWMCDVCKKAKEEAANGKEMIERVLNGGKEAEQSG